MRYNRIIWLMVLLVSAITARGQATALIANGDGTWTLASMPAYNVSLQVEYEDAGTPAESIKIKKYVADVDPDSFATVMSLTNVWGKRFQDINEADNT